MTINVKYSAEIDQPIDRVFQVATNLSDLPRWSNVREVRRVSSNPIKIGTTFQLVSHLGGQDRLVDCKVTAFEAPRKFVYVNDEPGKSEIGFDLQPIGDRTKLIYTVSVTVNAFIEPMLKAELDKQAKQDLNRFLQLFESAP